MLRLIFVVVLIVAGAAISTISAFHGLLFYLWNAYFRPESWIFGDVILRLRLSFVIGAYVVLRTVFSGVDPKASAGTVLIWLFFVQCLISSSLSEHPATSWSFLFVFFRVVVITYVMVLLINDPKQFRLALLVIALSLGFETAKQGWVSMVRAPGAKNSNINPFLGDNNGVALGTMMLFPLLVALAQTSRRRWEQAMHRFVGIGVLIRGITTYSRGGFLGAAALAVIHLVRTDRKLRALLGIVVLSTLIWTVMPETFWSRIQTIDVSDEERDKSAQSRLDFWQVSISMARENPLTGVGLNGFSQSFDTYNTNINYEDEERAAHSIWFGVLGDLGYPGLLLFVLNIAAAFLACRRTAKMTRGIAELRHLNVYANALISSLAVYVVSGSFLSYQYNEMAWHLFGLSTALYFIASKEARLSERTPSVHRAA
jgi:putative inorganic carbon (hco3(-)) transporter